MFLKLISYAISLDNSFAIVCTFLVTVQSQANLINICAECLQSKAYNFSNLFGGYATSKHVVFSKLGSEQLPFIYQG
jgi:hypothetical protein